MVGKHRVEGVDFGSPNCPESIFTSGQFFGSFDALGRRSTDTQPWKIRRMSVLVNPFCIFQQITYGSLAKG